MKLWDFRVEAERLPDGHYRVRVTATQSGVCYERTGYHPLWELLRCIRDAKGPLRIPEHREAKCANVR